MRAQMDATTQLMLRSRSLSMFHVCRWSAAEIFNAAQGRHSRGPRTPRSSAVASLNRQHANNRSTRRIDVSEPGASMEPCGQISSTSEDGMSEPAQLAEGVAPLAQAADRSVAGVSSSAAELQRSPEGISATSGYEQPGMQGSIVHCRRRGSLSPRREAGSSADGCEDASCGLAASHAHRSTALSGESEVSDLLESRRHGLTFVVSQCVLRAAQGSSLARRLLIDSVYRTLQHISYNPMSAWANISTDVLDIQITYHV